jgi:hypothetical protein
MGGGALGVGVGVLVGVCVCVCEGVPVGVLDSELPAAHMWTTRAAPGCAARL